MSVTVLPPESFEKSRVFRVFKNQDHALGIVFFRPSPPAIGIEPIMQPPKNSGGHIRAVLHPANFDNRTAVLELPQFVRRHEQPSRLRTRTTAPEPVANSGEISPDQPHSLNCSYRSSAGQRASVPPTF